MNTNAVYLSFVALASLLATSPAALARQEDRCARCYGAGVCRACTNCRYCAWCNSGGSCGVCAGSSLGKSRGSSSGSRSSGSRAPALHRPSSSRPKPLATPTPAPPPPLPKQFTATVIGVESGEALVVRTIAGRKVKVLLYGVDAPEQGKPLFKESRQFLINCAYGQLVEVERQGVDKDGLLKAFVKVIGAGITSNSNQIISGMAWWNRKEAPNNTTLPWSEDRAADAKIGLWSLPGARSPWGAIGK